MIEQHEIENKLALRRERRKVEARKRLEGEPEALRQAMTIALLRGSDRVTCVAGPSTRKRLPPPQLSMF